MDEEEEEMERNINNIPCNNSFKSPVTKSIFLEGQLAAGVLAEMVENVKGCSIQSDKHVGEIVDSKEHVDARNWLRNDSAKQVDVRSDSEKLVVDGSDPKSDLSIATHTTNGISATDTTNAISTQ